MKPRFSPCCDRSCVKMADSFADLSRRKDDRMIKQLLNSVMAKYHDLSVSRASANNLSARH